MTIDRKKHKNRTQRKLHIMQERKLTLLDAIFLYGESQQTMMHVAGLLTFQLPEDAPPDYLKGIMENIKQTSEILPPWNLKLKTPHFLKNPMNKWIVEENMDLDFHIRRSALPFPGGERELGILVSSIHSHQINFTHPPWELHLIEGLHDRKFVIYTKVHHSLVDGYTSTKILTRGLSESPDDLNKPMFFSIPSSKRSVNTQTAKEFPLFTSRLEEFWDSIGSVKQLGEAMMSIRKARKNDLENLVSSFQAPNCILNRRIGRPRRFATQQYSIDRLKNLGKSVGGTLNDVVIAICSGGLRKFLLQMGQLPEKPLIAFLPVNIRPKDDPGGGNAIGAMLTSMATDIEDPRRRIDAIIDSTTQAKKQMTGMSQSTILAYSALLISPFGLQFIKAITKAKSHIPLTFNVCISNVPGPSSPLYFRGTLLESCYPVSIPFHGMALNITCQSYNGTLNFGFIGCRDTLPHLQNLAVFTGEALEELEKSI